MHRATGYTSKVNVLKEINMFGALWRALCLGLAAIKYPSAHILVNQPSLGLPSLGMREELAPTRYRSFGHPSTDVELTFFVEDSEVGTLRGVLSPTDPPDCLYVNDIQVNPKFRRRGYGSAMLVLAGQRFESDITPLMVRFSASPFWVAAAQVAAQHGVVVRAELRIGDMDEEALRWTALAT